MIGRNAILAPALALGLVLGTPAVGQEQVTGQADKALTEDAVRGMIDEMMSRAEAAAGDGEWQGITDWMREHFADNGSFTLRGVVISGVGPPTSYGATLDSEDIARVGAMATDGPLGAMLAAVSEYRATAEVEHVALLPNGEASAEVEFRESAGLDLARLRQGGAEPSADAGDAGADLPASVAVQSNSTCQLRLTAGEDGGVLIRLAVCATTTTF